jgi:hypothetical protein
VKTGKHEFFFHEDADGNKTAIYFANGRAICSKSAMKDGRQVYSTADGLTGTVDERVIGMLDAILTNTVKMPAGVDSPKLNPEDLVTGLTEGFDPVQNGLDLLKASFEELKSSVLETGVIDMTLAKPYKVGTTNYNYATIAKAGTTVTGISEGTDVDFVLFAKQLSDLNDEMTAITPKAGDKVVVKPLTAELRESLVSHYMAQKQH